MADESPFISLVVPRQAAKHIHASRNGGRITRCNLTFSTATIRQGTASEVTCPRCRERVVPDRDDLLALEGIGWDGDLAEMRSDEPPSISPWINWTTDTPIDRIIGEAVGAASLCWDPPPEGVFDPARANDIVEAVMDVLRRKLWADA